MDIKHSCLETVAARKAAGGLTSEGQGIGRHHRHTSLAPPSFPLLCDHLFSGAQLFSMCTMKMTLS